MKSRFPRSVFFLGLAAVGCGLLGYWQFSSSRNTAPRQIFLYGELHSNEAILEREFELWAAHYKKGMRHLFVELPYYSAEFLNLWMKAKDDTLLLACHEDMKGAAGYSQASLDFYKKIKAECPETVFHGTDVGHQYGTTGKRYLEYLKAQGQEKSEHYRLAEENIEQGKRHYHPEVDDAYRENKMVENFVREFEALKKSDVVGIYGAAHTVVGAMNFRTHEIPGMASQLHEKYGDALKTENLALWWLDHKPCEPLCVETFDVQGKVYKALYFGEEDLTSGSKNYALRKFWRLEEAFEDFKDGAQTGDWLPYDNYPVKVEPGQVFLIQYTRKDGTIEQKYYVVTGKVHEGMPITLEVQVAGKVGE